VFAPSPRRVTADQVAAIVPSLPAELEKIGVFVDASFEEIEKTVVATGLTGVQLHFNAAPDLPAQLRARLGPALRILRVVHFDAAETASAIPQDPTIDGILVDSRTASSKIQKCGST
jgi:phosphoribosylanthranilate isomerase